MFKLTLLFLPLLSFAGESLLLTPGVWTNSAVKDPDIGANQSWRVEFQIHNWTLPLGLAAHIFNLNGVGADASIYADGRLALTTWHSTVSKNAPCLLDLRGRTNVLIRLQRDMEKQAVICEIWNSDGSGYAEDFDSITGIRPYPTSGGDFGSAVTNTRLDFFRVFRSVVAPGSRPPTTAETGDWTDLRFDGTLQDDSGNGHDIDISGAKFENSPTQTPTAIILTTGAPPWTNWTTLRAGYPAQLNGSHSFAQADSSNEVSYLWYQLSGPSQVAWSDQKAAQPIIEGLVFGEYKFRLKVTDAKGQTGVVDQELGAVATDDNGVVIYPDSRLDALLGPAKMFGANPWEWFDYRNKVMFEYWANNYEINGGTWRLESDLATVNGIPRSGTVFTRKPGNKIYGTGTNFLAVFCGGKIGPAVGIPYLVPKMPTGIPNDTPRPYPRAISSCQSDTEVTMLEGWQWERESVSSPGTAWGTFNICTDCGNWSGQNSPSSINFYGNDLAHYALYYRSGWLKARDSARWLADRWYRSPWQLSFVASMPRNYGLTGAYIRAAIDGGQPTYDSWPSLRAFTDTCYSQWGYIRNTPIIDIRETGYCLGYTALQATLDPDPANREIAQSRLEKAYSWQWGTQQKPEGNYVGNDIEGDFSRNFSVSQDSNVVTRVIGDPIPSDYCGTDFTTGGTLSLGTDGIRIMGAGTNFVGSAGKIIVLRGTLEGQPWSMTSQIASSPTPTATSLTLIHPWRGDPGSVAGDQWRIYSDSIRNTGFYNMFFGKTNSVGNYPDPQILDEDNWYWCTVTDDNHLALDKPYTGQTTNGDIYRRPTWQNLAGRGSQPFMHGILAWALNLSSNALQQSNPTVSAGYKTAANKVADWIWTYGRNPQTKGLFYGVGFSNCKNLTILPAHECAQDQTGSSNERAYNVESNGAFAQKYLNTLTPSDLQRGDTWYTDQFARSGYASPIAGDGNYAELIDPCCSFYNEKAYGQAFGMGQGHQWPAARLGGVAAPKLIKRLIPFKMSRAPSATMVQILVTQPSSAQVVYSCLTSPCEITLDQRQGAHWIQIRYLNSSNESVWLSDPQLMRLP